MIKTTKPPKRKRVDPKRIDALLEQWDRDGVPKLSRSALKHATLKEIERFEDVLLRDGDTDGLFPFYENILRRVRSSEIHGLISDSKERADRPDINLKIILDFLRLEPYSDVVNMALVLRMGEDGARDNLNKFTDQGWLIRDEVVWPGSSRKKHFFGVSLQGLYHMMDIDTVAPKYTNVFSRGQVNNKSGPHILGNQLVRLYHQRLDNPDNKIRRYTPDTAMPSFGTAYAWYRYPDGIFEDCPIHRTTPYGTFSCSAVAIETERSNKGPYKYRSIIHGHLSNIDHEHYDMVIYYLPTADIAANLECTFRSIIETRYKDKPDCDFDERLSRFQFDTYQDLPKRIQEIS